MSFKNLQNRHTFNMPDGSILHSCPDVDRYYNLGVNTTRSRLSVGWTEQECANNKRKNAKYTFNMPDGSILYKSRDVDRYYNLGENVTSHRLKSGWTVEECVNNRRNNIKYTFNMPDGSVLHNCRDVDRYYNLQHSATSQRLNRGWTEQECANNGSQVRRPNKRYTFRMPDGSILNSCSDVDKYYNLGVATTRNRIICLGWTLEECANNKRERHVTSKYTFYMPDSSILYTCRDVDRYYNIGRGTTLSRLRRYGWTEQECANNKREKHVTSKYTFNMPDGSILHNFRDVDNYYNLMVGTTNTRVYKGWTEQECANNRIKNVAKMYTFNMPDGSVLHSCSDVDRYYNLGKCVTAGRLRTGWTVEECANNRRKNKRKGGYKKYIFNMPDGSILHNCRDVDRYYNLQHSATSQRLNRGWTLEECANNSRVGFEKKEYTFNMPDGSVLYSCADVDKYHNVPVGTTSRRLRHGWTEQECINNSSNKEKHGNSKYVFNMPDGSTLYGCQEVDKYYNKYRGTTSRRLLHGWTEQECANNKREKHGNSKYVFNMPDGSTLYKCVDVDRYYNLNENVTIGRLYHGWTLEECANNKRKIYKKSKTFNMPDGSILYKCVDVDRYYNLGRNTTRSRLSIGWTVEECANNTRNRR